MGRWFKYLGAMVVWASLAACSDKSYNGIAPDGSSVYYEDERLPVMITIGRPEEADIVAKGSGSMDYENNEDPWNGKDIYVYAFKRDLSTSFEHWSNENLSYCLVDGSNDAVDNPAGKVARKSESDIYLSWTGIERRVMYPIGNEPYDFYAYFLDDIQVKPEDVTRTVDSITVKVEIDGTQDLMSSIAELTYEQLHGQDFTDEEREELRNYAFSSFTAAKGVHPTFVFKHHLSRIRFVLYPQTEEADMVYVDSIKLVSRSRGVFTVAHKSSARMGVDFSGDLRTGSALPRMLLTEGDGSPLRLNTYHTDFDSSFTGSVYEREGTVVGGSILAAPGESYTAYVYLSETGVNGEKFSYENVLEGMKVSNGENFLPGRQYNVRLAVYGAAEVEVSVVLEGWEDGGDIVLDPDEEFENENP